MGSTFTKIFSARNARKIFSKVLKTQVITKIIVIEYWYFSENRIVKYKKAGKRFPFSAFLF